MLRKGITGGKAPGLLQSPESRPDLGSREASSRWSLYRAWGTKAWLLANGPIWAGHSDLALILAHILSENMSKSNREPHRGELGVRNATNKVGF